VLPPGDPYAALHKRVREALLALPDYFRSDIVVSGILATDIFTLNAPFAAAIEEQTVASLNDLRSVWDPESRYQAYSFVRQPQTFPDVRLQRRVEGAGPDIIMGIELKGWYLFAKEGEPSYRFAVTPASCHERDLLVVFPWALNSVISGSAKLFDPYIETAKYAAEYRNWHWQHGGENPRAAVQLATGATTYPAKADEVSDRVQNDAGGNFGRIARTSLMDAFKAECDAKLLSGIQIAHWRRFFRVFKENTEQIEIDRVIERTMQGIERERGTADGQTELTRIRNALERIVEMMRTATPAPPPGNPRRR
jgi:hypothetical protein